MQMFQMLTRPLTRPQQYSRWPLILLLSSGILHSSANMAQVDPKGDPFPALINDCAIRAFKGEKTEYVPVWIMRQAGRYLPEFRELRKEHSFFEVCKTPELACEVTLQPIRRYNLDAAIIFSDILTIPEVMGFGIEFSSRGMEWDRLINCTQPIVDQLKLDGAMSRLSYVFDAITLTRHRLEGKVPLFGFSGAPYTLLAYMITGAGNKTGPVRECFYNARPHFDQLLDILTDHVIEYMIGQVKAGAQLLQLFESCGDHLTPEMFKEIVYPGVVKIAKAVKKAVKDQGIDYVPFSYFIRNAQYAFKILNEPDNDIDVLGVDWATEPEFARSQTNKTLQGNLDPWLMIGSKEQVRAATDKMVRAFGPQKYVANFGHGITPEAKSENVEVFIETVHSVSRELNQK